MKPREALDILYRGHERDLTSEGLQEALARLRSKHKALAKRVERVLEPLIPRLFPRARVHWWKTSLGRTMRVALLSENPHFQQDVGDVRKVLGIPLEEISVTKDKLVKERFPTSLKENVRERALAETTATWWIHVHRASALARSQGTDIEEVIKDWLSPALRECAEKSSSLDFQNEAVPAWLRRSPSLPGGRESFVDLKVPLDRAAARLVERYDLPWAAFAPIRFYVLTLRQDALSRVPSRDIVVQSTDSALQVTVEGLDEFTTKKEWEGIWDRYIARRLQARWHERGQAPRGKRAPDLQRLKDGLPLYKLVRVEKVSYIKALSRLAAKEEAEEILDTRTASNLVRDLGRILEPRDDGSGADEARV